MRKFKIKNRRKRKYVKKDDLAATYSSVQSLTVGFVPLILMAIAFFATIIMYNPPTVTITVPTVRFTIPEVTLPNITVPELNLKQPQVPTVSLPKITLPEMPTISVPRITLPNPMPFITSSLRTSAQFISTSVSILIQGVVTAFTSISEAVVWILKQISSALVNGLTAAVQFLSISISTITTAVINMSITIARTITHVFSVTVTILTQIGTTLVSWLKTAITAIVNAWNAFVWFLGTPFRALHAYSVELSIFLAPYIQYISESFEQSSDGLRKGGETLMNGTVYVANTIEENKK